MLLRGIIKIKNQSQDHPAVRRAFRGNGARVGLVYRDWFSGPKVCLALFFTWRSKGTL